jgi:hypothetical protein
MNAEPPTMKLEAGKRYVTKGGEVTTRLRLDEHTGLFLGSLIATNTIQWFPTGEPVDHGNEGFRLVREAKPYLQGKCQIEFARDTNFDHPEQESTPEFQSIEEFKGRFDTVLAEMTDEEIRDVLNPPDNVNHPSHYTRGGIEAIDGIESAISGLQGDEAWLTANVLKYCWRWKSKNGIEDLRKASWYLNRLISKLETPTQP